MPELSAAEFWVGPRVTLALFGGVYNNYLALDVLLRDTYRRGAAGVYFLGDVGGFGPHPARSVERLRESAVRCMAGNYDVSVGNALADCGCGYTDPRDNHYAQISYDYTLDGTTEEHRRWLAALPTRITMMVGKHRVLLVHGSPRRINEFLWESTTPAAYIHHLCELYQVDLIVNTHTGIAFERRLADGRGLINVGAIGRPANNGRLTVEYVLLHLEDGQLHSERVALEYDHARLAAEMEGEGLPPEFVATIRTGWWTTCLEILPTRERRQGRF